MRGSETTLREFSETVDLSPLHMLPVVASSASRASKEGRWLA